MLNKYTMKPINPVPEASFDTASADSGYRICASERDLYDRGFAEATFGDLLDAGHSAGKVKL
jgi:hypothetical protein